MGKKRIIKVFAFLMALCILMNYNLVFDRVDNGPIVEFGQEAKAVSRSTFSFSYSEDVYRTVIYIDDDPYDDDPMVKTKFTGNGNINVEGNRVYGSVTINYTLKSAYKYNTFDYFQVMVNNNGSVQIGNGSSKVDVYDINRNSGTCTIEFDFYLSGTYSSTDTLDFWIYTYYNSTIDYHDGFFGSAYVWIPIAEGKKIILNTSPAINSTSPSQNQIISDVATCIPSMTVSDPNGDILTCKYYVDSVLKGTKTTSNTATPQLVTFDALNTSTLSEGNHSFKFEVNDGKAAPVSSTVNVYVDKTPPALGNVSFSAEDTSITISGSATDSVSDASTIQYRYTVGDFSTNWISEKSKIFNLLAPDTEYNCKFEAMDKAGHITAMEQKLGTKAQIPQISISNINKASVDIQISDSNPSTAQYQLMAGASYVSSGGGLTSSPEWIMPAGKKITVNGLSPNTSYVFKARAKNSEGTETAFSAEKTATTLAQAPASIDLERGINEIKASWQAVNGASGYDIEADGTVFDTGTLPSYIHNNLQPETTHTYRVRVRNAGGTGEWSEYMTGTTLPNPPEIPAITESSTTQTAITISWDAVAKATGYEIEADGEVIDVGENTTYTHEGLEPDTDHKYRIRAKNEGGSSEWSSILEIRTLPLPPEIPINLEGKPTRTNITLSWSPAERAEGYEIDIDGNTTKTGIELSYVLEGLSAGSVYTYRIRAFNKGGKSNWSEPVTVTTWPEIPAAPSNLIATAEKESVTLTWYTVPAAESYDVEIDGKETFNVNESAYTDRNLKSGTEHTYRVRAKNISGTGEWSNTVKISTLPDEIAATTGPSIVSNIVAVVTNKTIMISWQAVEPDAQYEIEVDGVVFDNGKESGYNHTGLEPSTFHTYKVRTKDKNGNGQWCAVLALSTLPSPPDAPKNINATATHTQIELKWDWEEGTDYDVEIDGKVVDAGEAAVYIDDGLKPGTSHSYRVRGKNIAGVTAWSDAITKSTTSPSYEIECAKDREFDFSLLATNVQDFSEMTFVVTYNTDELEVKDLCQFTTSNETESCRIPGTNITVKFTPGRIEFNIDESIASGTTWSGEVSTVVFKAKVDGKVNVNLNIE